MLRLRHGPAARRDGVLRTRERDPRDRAAVRGWRAARHDRRARRHGKDATRRGGGERELDDAERSLRSPRRGADARGCRARGRRRHGGDVEGGRAGASRARVARWRAREEGPAPPRARQHRAARSCRARARVGAPRRCAGARDPRDVARAAGCTGRGEARPRAARRGRGRCAPPRPGASRGGELPRCDRRRCACDRAAPRPLAARDRARGVAPRGALGAPAPRAPRRAARRPHGRVGSRAGRASDDAGDARVVVGPALGGRAERARAGERVRGAVQHRRRGGGAGAGARRRGARRPREPGEALAPRAPGLGRRSRTPRDVRDRARMGAREARGHAGRHAPREPSSRRGRARGVTCLR